MRERILRHWYEISAWIAEILIMNAFPGNFDQRMKTLLILQAFLFLHFFEVFGFPLAGL
ncbi:MAG: hypothetical protein ACI4WR_06085 [Bulleidia sp.]